MSTNTYVALDKVTVGTATPSITFTGISGAYTDLVIVASIKAESTTIATPALRFNSDTTSNYSATWLYGNGSTASSSRASNQTYLYTGDYVAGVESTNFSTFISYIQNYSNTTTFKTVLSRNNQINSSDGETGATVGLWRKTPEAITSITYTSTNGANFAVGSTFSLYGIAASSVGAKATGGIISSDDLYYYHTFLESGTFTPLQSLTADYLVVAGGGGGGSLDGGGGGAGGLRSTVTATGGGGSLETALSLIATNYTVTIGAGGSGGSGATGNVNGSNGSDSVFSTITSTGGGFGGSNLAGFGGNSIGSPGGSGGGTGPRNVAAGAGTANQGYAGGLSTGTRDSGGGGGGANAVGAAGVNAVGGAGGAGVATIISGSSTTYAGGGGGGSLNTGSGGAGGSGGGGTGTNTNTVGGTGTANTGGGGGGSGFNGSATANGGAGGSGIVIVRYAK